jgi:GAF domain-containing protein
MVAVPLQLDDGRVLGVIEVLNKVSDREFTQDDLDLLLIVAELSATAMRRAERATALHDRMVSAMQSAKKTGPLPPSPS